MPKGDELKFQGGTTSNTEGEQGNEGRKNRDQLTTVWRGRRDLYSFPPIWNFEQAQRRTQHPVWEPIASSLELFLLGHAESPELGWETCVMLSAMAFERLLEPKKGSAVLVATPADHRPTHR